MASITTVERLSKNDSWVLNTVFNPENTVVQSRILVDKNLPPSMPHYSGEELEDLLTAEREAIRAIRTPQPDPRLVEQATERLSEIIAAHPKYASAYVNRAQALSILIVDEELYSSQASFMRWKDLSEAVQLATPPQPETKVSEMHAAVLASAHIQRGKIFWQALQRGNSGNFSPQSGVEDTELLALKSMDRERLEELASREFELAGLYGNSEGKTMAMLTNPYGRLCGGIVQEATRAEWTGLR